VVTFKVNSLPSLISPSNTGLCNLVEFRVAKSFSKFNVSHIFGLKIYEITSIKSYSLRAFQKYQEYIIISILKISFDFIKILMKKNSISNHFVHCMSKHCKTISIHPYSLSFLIIPRVLQERSRFGRSYLNKQNIQNE